MNEAEGIVEAGNRAIRQIGGEVAVDHHVDLDCGGSDGRRTEKAENPFEAWIVPNKEPAGFITKGYGAWNHDEPLGETSDKNTDSESVDGALPEGGIKDPGDE